LSESAAVGAGVQTEDMFHVEHLTFTISYCDGLQVAVAAGVAGPQGLKEKFANVNIV
jgi:hypothetical protein